MKEFVRWYLVVPADIQTLRSILKLIGRGAVNVNLIKNGVRSGALASLDIARQDSRGF